MKSENATVPAKINDALDREVLAKLGRRPPRKDVAANLAFDRGYSAILDPDGYYARLGA